MSEWEAAPIGDLSCVMPVVHRSAARRTGPRGHHASPTAIGLRAGGRYWRLRVLLERPWRARAEYIRDDGRLFPRVDALALDCRQSVQRDGDAESPGLHSDEKKAADVLRGKKCGKSEQSDVPSGSGAYGAGGCFKRAGVHGVRRSRRRVRQRACQPTPAACTGLTGHAETVEVAYDQPYRAS